MIELVPIQPTLKDNTEFNSNPDCVDTLNVCIEYYKKIGFNVPWICYYARKDAELVGSAAFKGVPVDNKVEIAYGTIERFRSKGIGKEICKALVDLALKTDPSVIITARTLPDNNHSTKILERNGFKLLGMIWDNDDGDVWEWEYVKQ